MWGNMQWWSRTTGIGRNERGNAMAEYTPLLAVIALVIFFSVSYFGGTVSDLLGGSDCPGGDWGKHPIWKVEDGDKKQAIDEDKKGNHDGMVCTKNPNGGGHGNQGNNQNVKDNNN
jgi:Flp pilus assembly pilin Flp